MSLPSNSVLRSHASEIWTAGLEAVLPETVVREAVHLDGNRLHVGPHVLSLDEIRCIAVIGAGKAGKGMVLALEEALGPAVLASRRVTGVVNVLEPDAAARPSVRLFGARPVGDPTPTAAGVTGSEAMLNLVQSLGPKDLAICLLSGGGSALMPCPALGVTLEQKREVTLCLSRNGADIEQLNTIRKHLSRVKGGRLAEACRAGRLVSIVISDVVGDRLDLIASGPTAPDPSTFDDALHVLEVLGLQEQIPKPVLHHLGKGAAGRIAETPKELPDSVTNVIVGNNRRALEAAWQKAALLGYNVVDWGSELVGESRVVGTQLLDVCRRIREMGAPCAPPACVLAGGESVVSAVAQGGKGGRNQELVLGAAQRWLALERANEMPAPLSDVLIFSGGTDGEDGPTDAAGAFLDDKLVSRAMRSSLDPTAYLATSRSYEFFETLDALIKTGPTGTNVMDLQIALVGTG